MMEFHEKLQALRKKKGLTQEELADQLHVSRTAVSKWESSRGYPNIDSLKATAAFFGVTVDELLSGDALLTVAEDDHKHRQSHLLDLVFGLLDLSASAFFFLPLFGQNAAGSVQAVSLVSLTEVGSYIKAAYFAVLIGLILLGILALALQNCGHKFWIHCKYALSCGINGAGLLLFVMSRQPYAAALLLIYLTVKSFLLAKRR
jgi:transcriptional regulator with XRE-family HTH domain